MGGKFRLALVLGLFGLAGCGDDASVQGGGEVPAEGGTLPLRVVDAVSASASCDAGEMLVSAYCFADPGRSISASGPAIQADAAGNLTVSCLTGGANLRLLCMGE